MATELATIKSTRTAGGIARPPGINPPELALTAFYGGQEDGPCLQITLLGSRSYIELTGNDVDDLIKELTQWRNTRFTNHVHRNNKAEDPLCPACKRLSGR